MRAIGVDVGGTKLAIGELDGDHQLRGYVEWTHVNRGYDELLTTIANEVAAVLDASDEPTRLGVAMAAWLSPDRERVLEAASLGWTDRPLRHDLAVRTGLDTTVHNDANCAAWGEYLLAGRPESGAFVTLTLGTDVGGGVIVDGRLLTGAFGLAGELGHLRVRPDGPTCVCGGRGCLAVYASGKAMLARYRDLAGAQHATGLDLARAAQDEEPLALEVITEAAWAIATASAQISRVIDHRALILGGGASAIGDVLVDAVRQALNTTESVGPIRPLPLVFRARAGNRAGVLGAAALASIGQES